MLLPLVFLVANAFKTPQEMLLWPPTIIPARSDSGEFQGRLGETPLLRWIGNSSLFACCRRRRSWRRRRSPATSWASSASERLNVVFAIILATAIVPFEVYMIPLYFQVKALGILNSVWGCWSAIW